MWLLPSLSPAASPEACAPCHRAETAAFGKAGMTRALQPGAASDILRANGRLETKIGAYKYEISGTNYSVSNGNETLTVPIAWSFGQGATGQTWLFEREGRWYESRVSYFGELKGLDTTIGQQPVVQDNLLEAAGRVTTTAEARRCFGCHSSGLNGAIPGIQCERCHGATEAHLGKLAVPAPLGKLTTEEMSDFCGQCHRTWSEIAVGGPHNVQNVRFQPYRLAGSKCYDAADPRIRCTACHNPHRALETNARSYDAKCLACHDGCKVGKQDCITCHMPKLDLPGAHKKFTDHRIRIVKPDESYPD